LEEKDSMDWQRCQWYFLHNLQIFIKNFLLILFI
jgi:hypothetical protein